MVYSSDASKWRAYQFSDPFAAGSFYVCNKINTHFCRPDCDAHPVTELHSEIKFVASAADAVRLGFAPCKACDPMSVPTIDVNLLLVTVREINKMIGFVAPLLDDDEDKVTEKIKENILGHNNVQRRMSVPMNTFSSKSNAKPAQFAVSKNDSEHYRLIDLACRHLALAAAVSIFNPAGSASGSGTSSPKSDADGSSAAPTPIKKGGRKRRGGVLGFKELATKSKLSAWHFHRVFKSIIGLTPKTYGDMCWEFLEKEKEAIDAGAGISASGTHAKSLSLDDASVTPAPSNSIQYAPAVSGSVTPLIKEEPLPYELEFQDTYVTPPQSHSVASPGSGQKRSRVPATEDMVPSPKRISYNVSSPHLSPFSNLKLEDPRDQMTGFDASSRAISVPNLSAFSAAPNSLFQHSRNFDFFVNREEFPSTDSVFASAAHFAPEYNPSYFSNEISPATIEDVSPLNGSAMISPEMPLSMLDTQGPGFSLETQPFKEEDLFPDMELFPDLFKAKEEYPVDYNLNDPMLSGLAPEMMLSTDF